MAFSKIEFCELYYVKALPFKNVAANLGISEQNLSYHMKKNDFQSRDRSLTEKDRFNIIQSMADLCMGEDFDADVRKVSISTQRRGADICNLIWPIWEQKFNKNAHSDMYPIISAETQSESIVETVVGPVASVPVSIYRLDREIEMPAYATDGSVAVDLRARLPVTIRPRDMAVVPCNIIVKIPDGYGLFLLPRSGLAANYAVTLANAPGLVDADYCGPEDEIKALVINHSSSPKTLEVKKGDRICQMLILPFPRMQILEILEPPAGKNRGGLGSTGVE